MPSLSWPVPLCMGVQRDHPVYWSGQVDAPRRVNAHQRPLICCTQTQTRSTSTPLTAPGRVHCKNQGCGEEAEIEDLKSASFLQLASRWCVASTQQHRAGLECPAGGPSLCPAQALIRWISSKSKHHVCNPP